MRLRPADLAAPLVPRHPALSLARQLTHAGASGSQLLIIDIASIDHWLSFA